MSVCLVCLCVCVLCLVPVRAARACAACLAMLTTATSVGCTGEEGDVDESLRLMEEAEALKQKKAQVQAQVLAATRDDKQAEVDKAAGSVNQKLRVCEVCGAMLSIFDSDRYVVLPAATSLCMLRCACYVCSSRPVHGAAGWRTTLVARFTLGTCASARR